MSGGNASLRNAFGVDQVYVIGIGGGKAGLVPVAVLEESDMVRLVGPMKDEVREMIMMVDSRWVVSPYRAVGGSHVLR